MKKIRCGLYQYVRTVADAELEAQIASLKRRHEAGLLGDRRQWLTILLGDL